MVPRTLWLVTLLLTVGLAPGTMADHGWTGSHCPVEHAYDPCATSEEACRDTLADRWCIGLALARNATVDLSNATLDGQDPEPAIDGVREAGGYLVIQTCKLLFGPDRC